MAVPIQRPSYGDGTRLGILEEEAVSDGLHHVVHSGIPLRVDFSGIVSVGGHFDQTFRGPFVETFIV